MKHLKLHATKRSESEKLRDLDRLAQLYIHGYSMTDIAKIISSESGGKYSITRFQILADLKKLRLMWVEKATSTYQEAIARELAEVDELERAYWDEFEKSKKDAEITNVEQSYEGYDATKKRAENKPTYETVKKSTKKSTNTGDIKCLEGIQWCINKRLDILGFTAKKRLTVTWEEEAREAGVNDPRGLFEQTVQRFMEGSDGSRSVPGSPTQIIEVEPEVLQLPG